MSFTTYSLIAFVAVCAILAIPRRTRPLIVPVTALWLIGVAAYDFSHDRADTAIGLLIVATGITASAIRDYKKILTRLKG